MSRLQDYYRETVVPQLMERLSLSNRMQVPRITKITLNMGVGGASVDKKVMDFAMKDLERIAGQKQLMRRARKSVATFKRSDIGSGAKSFAARNGVVLNRVFDGTILHVLDFVPDRARIAAGP